MNANVIGDMVYLYETAPSQQVRTLIKSIIAEYISHTVYLDKAEQSYHFDGDTNYRVDFTIIPSTNPDQFKVTFRIIDTDNDDEEIYADKFMYSITLEVN